MASKPAVDLELKKAFIELQTKMVESTRKINVIDSQMGVLKRMKQHLELTQREIGSLPSDTKTYESVGRMFVHTELNEVKDHLSTRENIYAEKIVELEKNKQYLEKNLKESEDNLREMIQQRKDQSEPVKAAA